MVRLPQTLPDFPGLFVQAEGSPSDCAGLRSTGRVRMVWSEVSGRMLIFR